MLKHILISIFILISPNIEAVDVGSVTEIKGKVTIHAINSPRGELITTVPHAIPEGFFIRTYSVANARIHLMDDSKILLTENSTMDFKNQNELAMENGQALFSINQRDAANSLNIITKTAVIGVKGTQFLVKTDDQESLIHLKEGVIEVKSIEQKIANFKAEFEAYKSSTQKEYQQYRKSMTLTPNKTVTVSGQGIRELASPINIDELYQSLLEP